MAILRALSLGQLQTLRHVLQEMESEGVMDLAVARERVMAAIDIRHSEIVRTRYGRSRRRITLKGTELCRDCQSPLAERIVDGMRLLICEQCRWSKISEDEAV